MERVSRAFIFVAFAVGLYFLFGRDQSAEGEQRVQNPEVVRPMGPRPEPAFCDLWTTHYHAKISTRGGVLVSDQVLAGKYRQDGRPMELVTTPDHPNYGPLYTAFRNEAGGEKDWLVKTDIQDFIIESSSPSSCTLTYADERVRIRKTFTVGSAPYSLALHTEVTNLTHASHPYSFSVGTAAYLLDAEVSSQMFRMNPKMTHVECVGRDGSVTRERPEDFQGSAWEDEARFKRNSINSGQWSQPEGKAALTAVSSAYFSDAVSHQDGPSAPSCLLQVDHRFHSAQYARPDDDPQSGAIYKARLAYEPRDLAPGQTESYRVQAYLGPKERKALGEAGEEFDSLIDLGFFSIIAKVLVGYLLWLYQLIPSWGVAIVLLTITARMLLFPMTWPSVKNMIHMRELKPEMDRLNEKFKDDPQAKGLAQMELWKKHGVNPMKGCLPQLLSMPVWFALYTTLQTAVELYHIPFLWFPDLSEADPYYILPFVIGAVFFVQQKLMPMQADPAQQKIMMYLMPGMFTVFMLFLPAGLGVYMFTNSLLGIVQQQVVERHAKKSLEERKNRVEVLETPGAEKKKKKRS